MSATSFKDACLSFKWGEYNALVCCYTKGHSGDHAYVVAPSAAMEEVERRKRDATLTERTET